MKFSTTICKYLNSNYKQIALILSAFLGITALAIPQQSFGFEYKSILILHSQQAGKVEMNISNLLTDRLKEAGIADVQLIAETSTTKESTNKLVVLLGISKNHIGINSWMKQQRIPPLTDLEPGSEGFLLKKADNQNIVIAAGVDERGCLYAVGEFLRQVNIRNGALQLPEQLEIRSAPAFEIRGTQVQQSGVSKELAKVRQWTEKETQRVILDYALAGANIFSTTDGPMFDFLKSYGLMTQGEFGPNTAHGDIPKEWEAKESIGRTGYVCLSVPEGNEYMLKL